MSNKAYVKGRAKEYRVCRRLEKEGYEIVQRTAGSHSPIDVIAIHKITRTILFVQAKPSSMSEAAKGRIEEDNKWLNGTFPCEFVVE